MNTSTVGIKIFKVIVLLGVITLCVSNIVFAGTYYVSNSGSSSWASAMNVSTPCSVSTAFANARAGDTVLFRGGLYNVPAKNSGDSYYGYYSPANSGASGNEIIFKAYPGETPLFNGTAGGTGDNPEYATIFGVARRSYITFDGFSLQANNGTKMARMTIYGEDVYPGGVNHITVKNCTFNGGTTVISSTDNREGLRIEDADYITVQKCIFYGYKQSSNWHNTSATKNYHTRYVTIENCEIYNCSAGIYDKSQGTGNIYRFNYIYSCYMGIFVACDGYSNIDGQIYNNVVRDCSYTSIEISDDDGIENTNGWKVYNNTIYQGSSSDTMVCVAYGANHSIYNNIFCGPTSGYGKLRLKNCTSTDESNYNCFYSGFKNTITYTGYSSLASWQATAFVDGSTHPDMNSLISDPLFINASGNMNTLADFALRSNSPCKGTGKGGVDRGANISLVGAGSSSSSSPDSTPPSRPTGVAIQIL